MIVLVKNLKCISPLNIHYYPNRRYKSYVNSLRAVIVGKSLISAELNIHRILHFNFFDKILQIYRQHRVRKFYGHILLKYRQISSVPAGNYLLKFLIRNTRTRYEICSKLTIKTPERRGVVLVYLLLILNIFHTLFYFSVISFEHLIACWDQTEIFCGKGYRLLTINCFPKRIYKILNTLLN